MPNIMLEDVMQKFGMDAGMFGQFSGIYYISYSLMHLPMGIMLDRYGPKKVMSLSIVLTALGLLPLLFAVHPIYPIIGRFLIGMGSSAAILGVFKVVRLVFKEKQFSRMLGFSVTIGVLGAIYGGGPVAYMKQTLGYDAVIQIFALAGALLAFVTYLIIPDVKKTSESSVFSNIKEVLGNKTVIAICFLAGLMVGPLEGFADVWGSAFLSKVYGFENSLASSLPSLIFTGMCFGAPLLSMVAEKMKSYLGTIIICAAVMGCLFAAFIFYTVPPGLVSLSFLLVGVCSAYQILAIYKASTYVREEVAGLTTAVANMIIMIFGYVFHTIIGTVVKAFGGPGNSEALIYGVSVIPAALFIAGGGFIFLRSAKPEVSRQSTEA